MQSTDTGRHEAARPVSAAGRIMSAPVVGYLGVLAFGGATWFVLFDLVLRSLAP